MGVKGLLRGFRLPLSTSTISTIICLSFPQSLAESASGSRTTLSIGISATTMNTDTLSSTASVGCGKSMLSSTLPYSLSISPHTKNRLSYIAMADSVNDPSTITQARSLSIAQHEGQYVDGLLCAPAQSKEDGASIQKVRVQTDCVYRRQYLHQEAQ